ncbi:hypothetical protein [Catenulispora subtropica]|uniref:DUF2567 domain-containing protein n=1 Tax=Catenulispora subtropica TaxID=450798 RepID=A0ABN2TBN8_9ACTN
MNDQTSPTAGGQGPGSSPWRNPFKEPQSAQGLPGVLDLTAGKPGRRYTFRGVLTAARADLLAAAILVAAGAALGVLAGLAWYRFAPTVWLTLPADAVSQVKANVDQSALLVAPEAKGIASVDGYFFVFTSVAGLLLGVLAFWLGRRGLLGGQDRDGQPDGAGVGAWAGVLLGGLVASTMAAALGHWISMPDPLTVLHTIAAGHQFHAPVALHAQGLYFAAPVLGMVLFLALTAAFTKASTPPWQAYDQRSQMFFSSENPYGFPNGGGQQGIWSGNGDGQGQDKRPPQNGDAQPGTDTTTQQADPSRS